MPSPNPDLTTPFDLPSPKPADPPDIPGDIKALAEAVNSLLAHRPAFAVGETSVTFASNGTGTLTPAPALGFVPDGVIVAPVISAAFVHLIGVYVTSHTQGGFQLKAKYHPTAQSNVSDYQGSITIQWVAFANPTAKGF